MGSHVTARHFLKHWILSENGCVMIYVELNLTIWTNNNPVVAWNIKSNLTSFRVGSNLPFVCFLFCIVNGGV